MKYPVFAIRDSKVGFMAPTVEQNAPAAVRNFEHAVLNSASLMNSHPGDYDLYEIGSFDSDSGELEKSMPKHLCSAADILR
jgi:hypothetical protein